jgi:toxin ParE1/3/4
MHQLNFTAFAHDDLLAISSFIALDNPKRAQSFIAELRKQSHLLAELPNMGTDKPEYADGIRMLAY